MKGKGKRGFSWLLVLTMILSLLPTTALAAEGDVAIDETNFPDGIFRQYISDNFDQDKNKGLSNTEISAVKNINVSNKKIKTLKGVEYFTALENLDCGLNQLANLDLSNNPALKKFTCANTSLTSLDLSNNPKLELLNCNASKLTSLDLSNNPALIQLECSDSPLTSLNLSDNPALKKLYCKNNQLINLNLSKAPALTEVYCELNELTSIDLSNNPALKKLSCPSNRLTNLDLSKAPALTDLNCGNNQLTSLDLRKAPALKNLYCSNNQLTSLNLNNNPALIDLNCISNRLTSLDLNQTPALIYLNCSGNELVSLDLSKIPALMELNFSENKLTSLDLSKTPALKRLSCYSNQLTELDLSKASALTYLNCSENKLMNLDLSKTSALAYLICSENELTSLDLSKTPLSIYLDCDNNIYKVTVNANFKLDLSTLPGSFDVTKASNWVGGTVDGNILTVNEGATEVTYKYNAGNGNSVNFKLLVEVDASTHTHNWTDDYSGKDETHHWNICQSEGCDITEISLMDGYGEHVYTDDTDATCDTCGYEREVTEIHEHDWTTDYSGQNTTHHWNLCQNEGCNITESSLMDGYGEHNFGDDNICDTCGYTQPDVPATEFTITFDANGGKVDTKTATTEDGKLAVLPTPTRSGYRFKGWFTEDGTKVKTTTIFTEDTTVFAEWKKKSSSSGSGSSSDPTYSIKVEDTEHGDVKVSPSKVEKGDKVTITVKPDSGYELKDLTVTDKNGKELELKDIGNDKYTFTMSGSKVEVKPVFAKADTTPQPSDFKATEKIVLTLDDTTMVIFGQTMKNDVAPVIRNERTMLPIRVIAETMGAKVVWDDALNKVTITKDDFKIDIYIGSQLAFVNDKVVELDAPAFIENSRTYLPLRFVAENLGALVLWDDVTKEVTIVPNK